MWVRNEDRIKGISQKLEPSCKGPYTVKKNISDVNCIIQLDNKNKETLLNHNKLKPHRGDNPSKMNGESEEIVTCESVNLLSMVYFRYVYHIYFKLL